MAETARKEVYQNFYTFDDFQQVNEVIDDIMKEAQIKASEVLEPTIFEKREVMKIIREYISEKRRKVYGGTSYNELIKVNDPADAIYDEYTFSDIEFYSPTPVIDLVELCNILFKKNYKFIRGKEAQHGETYSIFVNMTNYCDISYVPQKIYYAIKTIQLNDGILYTHPHFMFIDYLRIVTDPMNSAWRWSKIFCRIYRLLKYYPLEYFNKQINISKYPTEIATYHNKIRTNFFEIKEIQSVCLLSGFDAYNFFIKHAAKDRNVEQMTRTINNHKIDKMLTVVPFIEIISVNYTATVERLYDFIKKMVEDNSKVTIEEHYPFFQFTNHSTIIKYNNHVLVRVYEAYGVCVPNINTTRGYMYVSFQFLLLMMFINKFKSYVDKDQKMYFNYGIAISNLIEARNVYLTENELGVINNTVFGEFRISCVGSTISSLRLANLRKLERIKRGKAAEFSYEPAKFFNSSEESQAKFTPEKYNFRNTSGNKINNPKNLLFKLDDNMNIVKNDKIEEFYEEEESTKDTTETEKDTSETEDKPTKKKKKLD